MREIMELLEARSATPADRLVSAMRRLPLSSKLHLKAEDDLDVALQRIVTPPGMQGAGHARRALMALCKMADELGVTISLEARPDDDDDDGANLSRLIALARSCGFKGADDPEASTDMWRSPAKKQMDGGTNT